MNVVICSIAKSENEYILEWVDYHLNLGFSKIYIHDNNDFNGEKISDVIDRKVYGDKVEIIDVRGQKYIQKKVYNDFYNKYDFDWCAFIDLDEFITFSSNSDYSDINDYVSKYNQYEAIHLNWLCYGDNGYSKKTLSSVISRFHKPVMPNDFKYTYLFPENNHIKSIIKKGLDINWVLDNNDWSSNPHTPYGLKKIVDEKGTLLSSNSPFKPYSHDIIYIRHYFSKTIEEYALKIKRQCADCATDFYNFSKFYRANRLTLRKLKFQSRYDSANSKSSSVIQSFHEFVKYYIVVNRLPFFSFMFKSLRKIK